MLSFSLSFSVYFKLLISCSDQNCILLTVINGIPIRKTEAVLKINCALVTFNQSIELPSCLQRDVCSTSVVLYHSTAETEKQCSFGTVIVKDETEELPG